MLFIRNNVHIFRESFLTIKLILYNYYCVRPRAMLTFQLMYFPRETIPESPLSRRKTWKFESGNRDEFRTFDLRFRGSRYRSPFSSCASTLRFFFHDVCFSHAGAPNSTSSQFKERSARERETDFKRFLEVGEKLKAPQAGNADSEFSRWGHERGAAGRCG